MRQKDDRLFGMIYEFRREAGLVFDKECDAILARNIFCGDDCEFFPGNITFKIDSANAAARNGAADGGAVNHPWKGEVVDIAGAAGSLFTPFLTGHPFFYD